jgi:protocatechuate 3,4-dioxygenase beta subunit
MQDDDELVGRVLTRREVVRLLGAGGAAALAFGAGPAPSGSLFAQRSPGCVVKPEQTEGPYFVDQQLVRSDIRTEPSTGAMKPGVPLVLALSVLDVSNGQCGPLAGATVDVWQCDAQGVYSGVSDPGFNSVGLKFLRGVQTTDHSGRAQFTTIHPGWYPGRTVHIHFKIRTQVAGAAWEFTSQWYFDEALNDKILSDARYARPGTRDTRNANDMLYRNGGDQLLLAPVQRAEGYGATWSLGVDLTDAAVGRPDGSGAGPGRGGPGGRGRGGPGRGA